MPDFVGMKREARSFRAIEAYRAAVPTEIKRDAKEREQIAEKADHKPLFI